MSAPTCLLCGGYGPMARHDWRSFLPTDPCPDCGAITQAEPAGSRAVRVREALAVLREVLLALPEDVEVVELARLLEHARTLKVAPELEPAAEPEAEEIGPCPSCGAESQAHPHAERLYVCQGPDCGAVWSRSRRGVPRLAGARP